MMICVYNTYGESKKLTSFLFLFLWMLGLANELANSKFYPRYVQAL